VGTKEFLHAVQDAAREAGVVFMLDEVMTSRTSPGGLQRALGLAPDITILGKYLGGGLPIGAFGGRADILAVYDPRQPGALSHSGTFNNNTLTMHAGYAGLAAVWTDDVNAAFNAKGDAFRARLRTVSRGTRLSFTGIGSLLALHVTEDGVEDIRCYEDIQERWDLKDLFWMEMLEDGYWITRRGSISLILDTPDEELDRFVDCVERFLKRHEGIMSL
jgi:glutamate-1-semialdehyde 2,1-aminomutase